MARALFDLVRRADPRTTLVEREQRAAGSDSRLRPGDVVVDCGGGRVFYDDTAISPFSDARLRAAQNAGNPAIAAKKGYDAKVRRSILRYYALPSRLRVFSSCSH